MKNLYKKAKHSPILLLVSEWLILFVSVTYPLTYFGFPGPNHKLLAPFVFAAGYAAGLAV